MVRPLPLRDETGKLHLPPLPRYKEYSDWTHFTRPTSEKAGIVTKRKGMGGKNRPLLNCILPSPLPRYSALKPDGGPMPGCVCQGVGPSFICRLEITG